MPASTSPCAIPSDQSGFRQNRQQDEAPQRARLSRWPKPAMTPPFPRSPRPSAASSARRRRSQHLTKEERHGRLQHQASTVDYEQHDHVSSSATSIANNFDQFLTLLTTQLKNQIPLDPLDTNQFTAQLVQFAGVEQQLKTNETLGSLLGLSAAGTATNAVGFIGADDHGRRRDDAAGKTARPSGRSTLPRGGTATITIKNASGSVVQTADEEPGRRRPDL